VQDEKIGTVTKNSTKEQTKEQIILSEVIVVT